ncbi:MAG TPA: DUF433 domain-containing protein [Vicinamibacteria bacterium]
MATPSRPAVDLYRGRPAGTIALYRPAEVARYVGVPKATLRAWFFGQRGFKPVLAPPEGGQGCLSFTNLVEAHVLEALRRKHHLSLQKIRPALQYLGKAFRSEHPLVDHKLRTDGLSLFVDRYGQLINATRQGQLAMMRILEAFLERVEWGPGGAVARLYPFPRQGDVSGQPRAVVIDPRVAMGRPVLAGTNIPALAVAQRWRAGEPLADLARDYDRPAAEIEEAVRWAA